MFGTHCNGKRTLKIKMPLIDFRDKYNDILLDNNFIQTFAKYTEEIIMENVLLIIYYQTW